jgi:hypothetical protein
MACSGTALLIYIYIYIYTTFIFNEFMIMSFRKKENHFLWLGGAQSLDIQAAVFYRGACVDHDAI